MSALTALAVVAQVSSCCTKSNCPCPANWVDLSVFVQAAPDAGALAGVEVGFFGAANGNMTCAPSESGALCQWPGEPVTAGSYTFEISAPGYRRASLPGTVTVEAPNDCGCQCSGATLSLSTVTLQPLADGG